MAHNNVFVSSTCHDLIDVRAEAEGMLRAMGFSPVLSDSGSSDFIVPPDKDSIEACLVNVRACDVFLMILSQRYGPSLKKAGYPDLSATHLEYREAVKSGKLMFVYVRDRLLGVYDDWRANNKPKDFKSKWLSGKDLKLNDLLDEHMVLVQGGKSNWCQPFKSSVDLKNLIARDLRASRPDAILERLIEKDAIPDLRISCAMASAGSYSLTFMNIGGKHAQNVCMTVRTKDRGEIVRRHITPILKSNESCQESIAFYIHKDDKPFLTELRYMTSYGMIIDDVFSCDLQDGAPVFVHVGKRFAGEQQVILAGSFVPWRTGSR